MARLSAAFAATKGNETAIVDDGGSVTWRAFDERVNRCLNGVRARGHEAGETIAVRLALRGESEGGKSELRRAVRRVIPGRGNSKD